MRDAASLLMEHEGLRLKPYTDTTGHITIGYGCNLSAGITIDEALYLLKGRIETTRAWLSQYSWFRYANAARQAVLIDMAYNLGHAGLLAFHGFIAALEAGDYAAAADHMLASEWAKQVGHRAVEDASIMRSGQ